MNLDGTDTKIPNRIKLCIHHGRFIPVHCSRIVRQSVKVRFDGRSMRIVHEAFHSDPNLGWSYVFNFFQK